MNSQLLYNIQQSDTIRKQAEQIAKLESEKVIVMDALKSLLDSFQHTEGNTKGNKHKTDIIKHNEDVRAALVKAQNIFIYGIKA
jgi:hypothetical protein